MQKLVQAKTRTPPEANEARTQNKLVEVSVCPCCGLELRKNYKGQRFCLECNISFADSKPSLSKAEEKAQFLVFSGLDDQQKMLGDRISPKFASAHT